MQITSTNEWNLAYREDFVNAMLAEMYLWKAMSGAKDTDDWKKAKEYAEKAIGSRTLAISSSELQQIFDCSRDAIRVPVRSSEFYIRLVDESRLMLNFNKSYTENSDGFTSGVANPNFVDLYDSNDRRKSFYFKPTLGGEFLNDKYNLQKYFADEAGVGCLMPFRLAGMYLIRAEAAWRMGDINTAANVLQIFKSSRYDNPMIVSQDADQILQDILNERKREFYLENDMLWLDMKRLGETVSRQINDKIEILKSDDFRYSFPIPKREMETNRNMKQNPGSNC